MNVAEIADDGSESNVAVIAIGVAAFVLAISILVISLVFWKTRREKQKLQLQVQQRKNLLNQYMHMLPLAHVCI